jgi:hypothetical protein
MVDEFSQSTCGIAVFDFFLSHNKAEKSWTRQLAAALRRRGVTYFFDEESIELGENVIAAIGNGLRASKHVVLILSADSVESRWVELEWASSLYEDVDASARKLIPILKSPCEIPFLLRRLNYLDARGLNIEDVADRLTSLVSNASPVEQGAEGLPKAVEMRRLRLSGPNGSRVLPIGSKQYVRRDADSRVESILANGGSSIVHGPRMIGKTSLLQQVAGRTSDDDTVYVFLDIQWAQTADEMWTHIAHRIANRFKKPWERSRTKSIGLQVHRLIESVSSKNRLVLLLDEFDALLRLKDSSATDLVRSLVNEGMVRMICACYDPYRFSNNHSEVSPWSNMFHFVRLEAFSLKEMMSFIQQLGLDFGEDGVQQIQKLTGGDPSTAAQVINAVLDGYTLTEIISNPLSKKWHLEHSVYRFSHLSEVFGVRWKAILLKLLGHELIDSYDDRRVLWYASVISDPDENPPVCSGLFYQFATEALKSL